MEWERVLLLINMLICAIKKGGRVGGPNFTSNWNFWNKSKHIFPNAFNDEKLKADSSLIFGDLRVYWMKIGLQNF